jgi:hypothetical protein
MMPAAPFARTAYEAADLMRLSSAMNMPLIGSLTCAPSEHFVPGRTLDQRTLAEIAKLFQR